MTASEQIDAKIASLDGWRAEIFTQLRSIINETDPRLTEDWKWMTAVWVANKPVCAVGAFKDHVKLNFFKGALMKDSQGLFNNGLDSKQQRGVDFFEHDSLDSKAIKALLIEAISVDA